MYVQCFDNARINLVLQPKGYTGRVYFVYKGTVSDQQLESNKRITVLSSIECYHHTLWTGVKGNGFIHDRDGTWGHEVDHWYGIHHCDRFMYW